MQKTSAVIFDCDGVLFDSRQSNIDFYNHLLAHFGLPLMRDEQEAFVHMHTGVESIRYIFDGTPLVQPALTYYRTEMDFTPFIEALIMEPGLKDLLDRLKRCYGLAVATNRSNTISEVLQHHGLMDYFDIVVSSLDVAHPKPHPECLRKILEFFGLSAPAAFYVGDSPIDSQTAKVAGVPFIAFKNSSLPAQFRAENLTDVAKIIGAS